MSDTALFLLLMLPGTGFLGVADILIRRILRDGRSSSQLLLIYEYGIGAVVLAILLFVVGVPEIQPGFWSAATATIILNVFAQWAWYTAFAREEASLIAPLRLLTPPLVIVTGYVVLSETPTVGGVAGILVTVAGLYLLLRDEVKRTQFSWRQMIRRPGILLGLWGAFSFALSLPFDKKIVVTSSPFFALVVVFTGLALGSALVLLLRRRGREARLDFRGSKKALFALPFVHVAASLLTSAALQYSLVAYAASVKRLWSLWVVLLSGAFLKEGNISRRLLATIVMLGGIALTVFFG